MKKKEKIFLLSVVANIILVIMVVNLKIAAVNNQKKADYFSEVCDYKQDHLMEVVCDYQQLSMKISLLNSDVNFYKSQLYSAEKKIDVYEALLTNHFGNEEVDIDMVIDDDEDDEDDDWWSTPSETPGVKEKDPTPTPRESSVTPTMTPVPTKKLTPTPTLPPVPASTSTSATTKKTERPCPTYYGIR